MLDNVKMFFSLKEFTWVTSCTQGPVLYGCLAVQSYKDYKANAHTTYGPFWLDVNLVNLRQQKLKCKYMLRFARKYINFLEMTNFQLQEKVLRDFLNIIVAYM